MKKNSGILTFFLSIFIFGFLIFKPALSQDASLLPNAVQQFFDSNGNPLSSGKVYFYQVGTSTLKDVYNSSAATTAYTNPITLNAGGKPPGGSGIYGIGLYRQLVKDKNGNTIWDAVTAPGGGGGGTPTGVGDGNAVGTVLPWSGLTAPNQYVFTYGQELVRTSYPEFYSAITLQTNVICTSSSNTLTGIADTTQIPVGAPVELALCVPPGSTVISKTSGTVTLNNPANVSLNATARFFPYGNGNGSTTFNVPDLRDMALIGRPNMGGTDRGLITSQYFGVNPAGLGAFGGVQTATLSVSNLPPYTPTGAVSLSSVDTVYGNLTTGLNIQSGITNPGAYNPTNLISQMSAVFIGQPQGGTMSPFSLIQPSITFNYIIKATPDTPMSTETVVTELGGMTGVISCGTGLTCADQTISVNSFGEATTAIKIPVKAATTANIGLFGAQTIDGVSVVAGDRVLVKDQSTASENGIYVVSNSNWTRATDFNEDGEVVQGTQVYVTVGIINGNVTYSVNSNNPIIINSTDINFIPAIFAFPSTASFNSSRTYNIFYQNTGSSVFGQVSGIEPIWSPAIIQGAPTYNAYDWINIQSSQLSNRTGASVSDLWYSNNFVRGTFATSSPQMANSHLIAHRINVEIPTGVGDGGGGNFIGNLPTNSNYQEIASLTASCFVLSPGHYCENLASYVYDSNTNGVGSVAANLVGVVAFVNKDNPANTYPYYGVATASTGVQQTTYAPDAAFRASGGWQYGLDFRDLNANLAQIILHHSSAISDDGDYLNFSTNENLIGIAIGNSHDQKNYYNNGSHVFRTNGGAQRAILENGLVVGSSGTDNGVGTVTALQFHSTVTTGTSPFVVASTTKVSNLYADRAALADTVTTNANLTGDITSVGNSTSYNNLVPTAKGGTHIDTSASTGVAQISAGTWSVNTGLANGTTATTQSIGDNSTKVATTAYADQYGDTATSYSPTAVCGQATGTVTCTASGFYAKPAASNRVFVQFSIAVSGTFTGGTITSISLPATSQNSFNGSMMLVCRENATTGLLWDAKIQRNSTTAALNQYDNTTTITTGMNIECSGIYYSQ